MKKVRALVVLAALAGALLVPARADAFTPIDPPIPVQLCTPITFPVVTHIC